VLGTEFDMDTDDIDTKLGTLQDEIMQLASSKSDYDNLVAEIHRLRSVKQETQEHNAQRQTKRQRISEMTEFLGMQSGIITEYDDKLTRQLIECKCRFSRATLSEIVDPPLRSILIQSLATA